MSVQVFFNKPARPLPTDKIVADLLSAKSKIAVAAAWFTDIEIANAIIQSPALFKTLILNQADINRGSRKAYALLRDYFERLYHEQALRQFANQHDIPQEDLRAISAAWHDFPVAQYTGLHVIGSTDWQEGVMHHKFILIDSDIVWTGSFNFTYQARHNYENLLRIVDPAVSEQYWAEAQFLTHETVLNDGSTQFAFTNGAFRCAECERLFSADQLGYDGGSWWECKGCARKNKRLLREGRHE